MSLRLAPRTLKQMHTDLVALSFDCSYNRVAAFVRAWTAPAALTHERPAAPNSSSSHRMNRSTALFVLDRGAQSA